MKVKVLKIAASSRETVSMLHGRGNDINGFEISFVFCEGTKPGMFYAGQNEIVAEGGKEALFFFKSDSAAEALYMLQQAAETVNYKEVKKNVKSKWIALDMYGREVECDTEDEAQEAHRKFGEPRRIDSISFSDIEETKVNVFKHAGFVEVDHD